MKPVQTILKSGALAAVLVLSTCSSPITLVPPAGPSTATMVATPTFSPTGGVFTTDQSVSMATSTSGASIYYTTDGTVPTTSSTLYSAPIAVSGNGSMKAIIAMGVLSGSSNSGLAAASFKVSHTISTIAGNGTSGFLDASSATSGEFYYPSGIAVDASGNYYVADPYNHRVRKVTNTGALSTVAGNGSNGLENTSGAATSSAMEYPVAVALDSTAANLYIADVAANAVYKVTIPGGIISLFAGTPGSSGSTGDGGAATSALLKQPCGLAVDSTGNVYISDYGNNVVRKVTGSTISLFAGNYASGFAGDGGPSGIAQLNGPLGLAVDSTGRVYIADNGNNRIRRVSTLATISTVAGGPNTNPYWQDGGPATSQLYGVGSVATDTSGNFYFTASSNVLKADTTGTIWNMAGGGSWGVLGDGGPAASAYLNLSNSSYYYSNVAVDSAGSLYITDTYNYRVRKVQ